jgi:hypothetical protein
MYYPPKKPTLVGKKPMFALGAWATLDAKFEMKETVD